MLRDIKIATNSQPPGISEVLLAEYFHRGFFEENMERMKKLYKEGRDAMMESMDKYFPKGFKRTTPDGGYYVWVEFPEKISAAKLKEKSEKHKFTFLTGGEWYPNSNPKDHDNTARFNFTTLPVETIKEGIKVIGRLACEMM